MRNVCICNIREIEFYIKIWQYEFMLELETFSIIKNNSLYDLYVYHPKWNEYYSATHLIQK